MFRRLVTSFAAQYITEKLVRSPVFLKAVARVHGHVTDFQRNGFKNFSDFQLPSSSLPPQLAKSAKVAQVFAKTFTENLKKHK